MNITHKNGTPLRESFYDIYKGSCSTKNKCSKKGGNVPSFRYISNLFTPS